MTHSHYALEEQLYRQLPIYSYNGLRDLILIYTYYARFTSVPQLLTMARLDTGWQQSAITQCIHRLTKEKLLFSLRLPKEEDSIRCLYCLTAAGHEIVNGLIEGAEPYISLKERNVRYLMHDYSAGMNFFQFLTSGIPFTFFHETAFTEEGKIDMKKVADAVSADAFVAIQEGNKSHIYFIEQDMGTEHAYQLRDKIDMYLQNHLLQEKRMELLFSFRKPYLQSKDTLCLNPVHVRTFLTQMEGGGYTGTLSRYRAEGGRLFERIRNEFIRFVPEGGAFTSKEVREYLSCLETAPKTSLLIKETIERVNATRQLHFFKSRMYSLWKEYHAMFYDKDGLNDALTYFIEGGSVYCSGTHTLAETIPYITFSSSISEQTQEWLREYYHGVGNRRRYATFAKTQPFFLNHLENIPITFKNVYSWQQGEQNGYVAVEYLSNDLGAFVRAYYGLMHMDKNEPFHIVLVADNMDDVTRFCEQTEYYTELDSLLYNRFLVVFLIKGENTFFILNLDKKRCDIQKAVSPLFYS